MTLDEAVEAGSTARGFYLRVVTDYADVSRLAADAVAQTVREHPEAAITLPTGETPRGMYGELVRRITSGALDFSRVHFFCLDEYAGKGIDDDTSLTAWLNGVFLEPARLDAGQVHLIPSQAADPAEAAAEYEEELQRRGGLKLAVVGLGPNGHVGFNEPGSAIDSRTRIVELTEASRDQNAAYYEGDQIIPDQAMSMGIGTILDADRIVLIVSGAAKANILKAVLEGPISAEVPGSFLRTAGDRLTAIVDRGAASALA